MPIGPKPMSLDHSPKPYTILPLLMKRLSTLFSLAYY